MRIAVLSGKGGTGKTLVSVNLASAMGKVTYIDADVEEPNGALFLKPEGIEKRDVTVTLPAWNKDACNGCKKCVDFCAFNALAYAGGQMLIFDEVCHSCGGCQLVCPVGAMGTRERAIGTISRGHHHDITVVTGMLNMGEASGVPIIRELVSEPIDGDSIIDCPPGSACTVMESIKGADYCILVAEPTLFGVHNLDMVYRLTSLFDKKTGVVLNKSVAGENVARDYCLDHDIPIVGEIMWSNDLGHMTSNGIIASEESKEYREIFGDILNRVREEVES